MGTRDNNGVRSKITHDVGRGSINRGEGQAGAMGEEGGLTPVGAEVSRSEIKGKGDMRAITGSKGSSGKEKDFGGVGSYGTDASDHRDFFKDEH